jgi:hypothetical protein
MKEMNDFLLNMFTASDEDRRGLMFPYVKNGIVYATNAYALIAIPEDELSIKYNNVYDKFPDIDILFSSFEKEDVSSMNVKMSDIAKELAKARMSVDYNYSKCKGCDGDGSVEWTYEDNSGHIHKLNGNCPVCNGDGVTKEQSQFERVIVNMFKGDDGMECEIDIGGLRYSPNSVYLLFMAALINGYKEIEISYMKDRIGPTLIRLGNIRVYIVEMLKKNMSFKRV